jgi:two-component system response regulator FlrC
MQNEPFMKIENPGVLVVEPDPRLREMLAERLGRSGFPVESVTGGDEALERVRTGHFGLVVSDEQIAGNSGFGLLELVKDHRPDLPVILMTNQGSVQNAVAAMRQGAVDYLLKPFSLQVFDAAVRKAVLPAIRSAETHDEETEILTVDPQFRKVLETARNVAPSQATILIQGESGTGKELLARFLHRHGRGADTPYLAVNCAALPETLAESELFGYEKGAFTGATSQKVGKFEAAGQGTIVLDEISEMPEALQAKLLRILQERQIDRVGGSLPVPLDARVVAVSNVDLKQAVAEGRFRRDLFYRINVVSLAVPPLRHRPADVPLLARHFCEKLCRLNGKSTMAISKAAMERLQRYSWPGNVRELENVIERAVLISSGTEIAAADLIPDAEAEIPLENKTFGIQPGITVREMERELIFKTLAVVNENRTRAAEMLGISIRTLRNKLREYRKTTVEAGCR